MNDRARPHDQLARLEELHEQVEQRLADLEGEAGSERGTDAGTWSVKDVYAHIARWDALSADELETLLSDGEPEEEPKYQILNAKWLAEDEELDLEEARARFADAFARYRDVLTSVAPESWQRVREWVETSIEHYEDHLRAPLEFEVAPGG